MSIEFQVQVKIMKAVAEVFDAVVNPAKLTGYFIGSSTGPLEEGKTVTWHFPEFPDMPVPVVVKEVIPNQLIRFEWQGDQPEYYTTVTMTFDALTEASSMITIVESGWRNTDSARAGSYRNCSGWMHMGMCMKAYLEFGINLRKDSFEPGRMDL